MKNKLDMHIFRYALTLAFLAVAAVAAAQTQAGPTSKFQWEQAAATLAAANAFRVDLEMDGVVLPNPVVKNCTGTTSPYACVGDIPALVPGPHSARIRVVDTSSITSLLFSSFSVAASFNMRAVPATPSNFRIGDVAPSGDDPAAILADFGVIEAPSHPDGP